VRDVGSATAGEGNGYVFDGTDEGRCVAWGGRGVFVGGVFVGVGVGGVVDLG